MMTEDQITKVQQALNRIKVIDSITVQAERAEGDEWHLHICEATVPFGGTYSFANDAAKALQDCIQTYFKDIRETAVRIVSEETK